MNKNITNKDKDPAFDRCVICQQSRHNCRFFRMVIFHALCHELWLLLRSLLHTTGQATLTEEQIWQLLPMLTLLSQMRKANPPIPDHEHETHLPAHWLQQDESKSGWVKLPERVDYGLMWQLQLNRRPHRCHTVSSSQLRANHLIRYRNRRSHQYRLAPTQTATIDAQAAVLQELPRQISTETVPVCSITLEVPKHPGRVVPCGHTFSFQAIKQWASQHPAGQAPCPNCRGRIECIEQICLPLPVDHRRLHESTYLLWLSTLPEARPVPSFESQETEITNWLLRHSLFYSNPGAQEMIRQRAARP